MGREALETARAARRPRADRRGGLGALRWARRRRARIEARARAPRRGAGAIDRLSDAELAPRLEALYYLGWAENYLEHYDEAIAHVDRGIAIARATGEGRLLVPMMLVKGYPFEMQGRLAEALELCETAVEAARLSANPHYLFWALFELGWAHYYRGDLDARDRRAARRAGAWAAAWPAARCPRPAAARGGRSPRALFEAGEVERALRDDALELGGDELEHTIPVERCFDWEILALAELARERPTPPTRYVARAEAHAATLGPAAARARWRRARPGRAAAGERATCDGARDGRRESVGGGRGHRRPAAGGVLARPARVRRWRPPATATARSRRCARRSSELDRCGSVRVRDEVRRELRKLGARAETRGPATGEDSGVGVADQARAARSPTLVTDRKTNREIAGGAVPQRQDGGVAHAQHLRQARGRPRGSRSPARSSASAASRSRRDRGDRPPADADAARLRRARLPAGAEAAAAASSTTWRSASRRSRRSSGSTRSCSSARSWPGRRGSGCCRSRWPASACCWRCTPSWRRSSRSPAAPTSGAGG